MTNFYFQFLSQVVMAMHYNELNLKEGKMYNGKGNKELYFPKKVTFGILCSPLPSM